MTNRLSRLRGDDSGLTLVELLVTMVMMGVISILLTTMFISVTRATTFNDDEQRGLNDTRKVVERMGRDVRQARGVDQGADGTHLVLWIDSNSDYRKSAGETITWQIEPSLDGEHFDVIRKVDGTVSYRQATTLVEGIAFSYGTGVDAAGHPAALAVPISTTDAPKVRLVTTSITYDALLNRGSQTRKVEFASRLRNVA